MRVCGSVSMEGGPLVRRDGFTKTPWPGGQRKYTLPWTVPLCFPTGRRNKALCHIRPKSSLIFIIWVSYSPNVLNTPSYICLFDPVLYYKTMFNGPYGRLPINYVQLCPYYYNYLRQHSDQMRQSQKMMVFPINFY